MNYKLLTFISLFFLSNFAQAGLIYNYTGAKYTSEKCIPVQDVAQSSDLCDASNPAHQLNDAMQVSFTINDAFVPSTMAPVFDLTSYVEDFYAFDGVNEYNTSTASFWGLFASFDSAGDITRWEFGFGLNETFNPFNSNSTLNAGVLYSYFGLEEGKIVPGGRNQLGSRHCFATGTSSIGSSFGDCVAYDTTWLQTEGNVQDSSSIGTWTTPSAQVPEPESLALFGFALAGFAFTGRKAKALSAHQYGQTKRGLQRPRFCLSFI